MSLRAPSQLLRQPPFQIVFPALQLGRGQLADHLRRELCAACPDDPAEV